MCVRMCIHLYACMCVVFKSGERNILNRNCVYFKGQDWVSDIVGYAYFYLFFFPIIVSMQWHWCLNCHILLFRWWQVCDMWFICTSLHAGSNMRWMQLWVIPRPLCHLRGTWGFRRLLLQRMHNHGERCKKVYSLIHLAYVCVDVLGRLS